MAVRQTSQEYQSVGVFGQGDVAFYDDLDENVPELRYPESVAVYKRMATTEPQVASLEKGLTLPVSRYVFKLDPASAPDEEARALAVDLGVPVVGEDPAPDLGVAGFSLRKVLGRILLAPRYGAYHFEILRDPGDGQGRVRLAGLAPIPPLSLASGGEVIADKHGNVLKLRQPQGQQVVEIPGKDVAAFVWGEEDGGYLGQSWLRPLYKPWRLKQTAEKIALGYLEVAGMGTVVGKPGASGSKTGLFEAGQSMRASPHQAIVLDEPDQSLDRVGVTGSVPDALGPVRYWDEQMAKPLFQMVKELGQTQNGSRALGDTLDEHLGLAQQALAQWVCDQVTERVLAPMVALNAGDGAGVPRLVYEVAESDELSVEDLVALLNGKAITPDAGVEEYLRAKFGLPDLDPTLPAYRPVLPNAPLDANSAEGVAAPDNIAAASIPAPLAQRGLRRALTDVEIAAAADFEGIDADWRAQLSRLLAQVKDEQAGAVAALVAFVEAHHDDPVALASIEAAPFGAAVIAQAMRRMAAEGVSQVAGEARAQGVAGIDADPDADVLRARSEAASIRLAQNLARSASNTAIAQQGLPAAELAQAVREHLGSLTDAQTIDELGGALTQAQNEGRRAGLDRFPDGTSFYASALLDTNACTPCSHDDGKEYASLLAAMEQFPGGGQNKDCEGGSRCRCTLVAVAPTESAPSVPLPGGARA